MLTLDEFEYKYRTDIYYIAAKMHISPSTFLDNEYRIYLKDPSNYPEELNVGDYI